MYRRFKGFGKDATTTTSGKSITTAPSPSAFVTPSTTTSKGAPVPSAIDAGPQTIGVGVPKSYIEGVVVGETGFPVRAATVRFTIPGVATIGRTKMAETTVEGRFRLDLSAGEYVLTVQATDYEDTTFGPYGLSTGETLDVGELVLPSVDRMPICGDGMTEDPDTGECVPIAPTDTCGEGYVFDPAAGCVPVEDAVTCPEGYQPTESGLCVAIEPVDDGDESDGEAAKPWYKSPLVWVGGGLLLLGGGYLVYRAVK